jgi:hypothetical protein
MTTNRSAGPPSLHHPAVGRDLTTHAEDLQLRIADLVTELAGSMLFVYLHVAAFAAWMLWAERSPWPTLTLLHTNTELTRLIATLTAEIHSKVVSPPPDTAGHHG